MNKKNLQFHIISDDYFGTLATTIDLLRQAIVKSGVTRRDAKVLEQLRDELLYLQAHYTIRESASKISSGTLTLSRLYI